MTIKPALFLKSVYFVRPNSLNKSTFFIENKIQLNIGLRFYISPVMSYVFVGVLSGTQNCLGCKTVRWCSQLQFSLHQ